MALLYLYTNEWFGTRADWCFLDDAIIVENRILDSERNDKCVDFTKTVQFEHSLISSS